MTTMQQRAPLEPTESCLNRHKTICGFLGFKSAHTLINRERARRNRAPLVRSAVLDRLCQIHALAMAQEEQLAHTVDSAAELRDLVNSDHAGENIQRGPSVEEMHKEAMLAERSAYKNILGKKYREFGIATAKGGDGKLYMCQLFRGSVREPSAEQAVETQPISEEQASALLSKVDIPKLLERARSLAEEEGGVFDDGHGVGLTGDDEKSTSSDRPNSLVSV